MSLPVTITLRPSPPAPKLSMAVPVEVSQFIQNSQQWSRDAERSLRALQGALNDRAGLTVNVDVLAAPSGSKRLVFVQGILTAIIVL